MRPRKSSEKKRPLSSLGALQARIMERLWAHGPQALAEVHRSLAEESEIAYTTVATELTRLHRKGLVLKHGIHLATRYQAAIERETFVERLVGGVLQGLLGTHGRAAIHGFVDAIADDRDALEETLRLLQERRPSP
jgi:predicted transcriptional regulator